MHLLVAPCPSNQIAVSILWRDPPLEHYAAWTGDGEPITIPGWRGGVAGHRAVAAVVGALSSLRHRTLSRLRLLQPVRHPHLAVRRRRGGEVLAGLIALARAPVELAEAEVAVGDEGAHAARL